ncbi:MAG TPA: histidine phosphatase family protein [Thermomonas sp.]|nr:histidine phosphatase family protein [Thermomonas sp.]
MRELILLRHAHAESAAAGQDDLARGLSDTGRAEAQAAGDWLREHGLRPDRVLCSNAARTRDTLAALGDIGAGEIYEDASIYEASPGTLASLVDANRDVERLLLVGHNPGIEQLAALMHSGQTGDYRGMPPGGIAVLKLPVDVNIEPGIATLTQFWWP